MRRSTIPALDRFTHMRNGAITVEISRNWMKEFFDYEELGCIEDLKELVDRNKLMHPGKDETGLVCMNCNADVQSTEWFCWSCGQRLRSEGVPQVTKDLKGSKDNE